MRINDVIQEAQWDAPGGYSAGRNPQHGKVKATDKPMPARLSKGREPIEDPESDYEEPETIGQGIRADGQTMSSDPEAVDNGIRSQEVHDWLHNNKKLFTRSQWETLIMRFYDEMTLDDVAQRLGITKEKARQKEAKALYILRHNSEFKGNFKNTFDESVVDEEPASRALCTSGKPDSALGASQLSSCKSQGYRSRDGGKSHKVGSERIKVRGKKIKGKKYGGPLPDWS